MDYNLKRLFKVIPMEIISKNTKMDIHIKHKSCLVIIKLQNIIHRT